MRPEPGTGMLWRGLALTGLRIVDDHEADGPAHFLPSPWLLGNGNYAFFRFADTPDPEGKVFPSVAAKIFEAVEAMIEMVKENLPDGNHRELSMGVREEDGDRLVQLELEFDAQ